MSLVNFSNIQDTTTIDAADVNGPLNTIYNDYNGNIDSSNIKDGSLDSSVYGTGSIGNAAIADNSITNDKVSAGAIVQVLSTGYASVATGTTTMNDDDNIPVITEGTEFMTQAITPKSATNRLRIEAVLLLAPSAAETINAAIFVGTTTNALAANGIYQANPNAKSSVIVSCDIVAGSTSELTFRVKAGLGGAGTVTFNGQGGSRRFGDIPKSYINIIEYKA